MSVNPYSPPISSHQSNDHAESAPNTNLGLKSPLTVWLLSLSAIPITVVWEASEAFVPLGWFHLLGPLVALLIPIFTEPSILRKLLGFLLTFVTLFIVFFISVFVGVMLFGFSAT